MNYIPGFYPPCNVDITVIIFCKIPHDEHFSCMQTKSRPSIILALIKSNPCIISMHRVVNTTGVLHMRAMWACNLLCKWNFALCSLSSCTLANSKNHPIIALNTFIHPSTPGHHDRPGPLLPSSNPRLITLPAVNHHRSAPLPCPLSLTISY